MPKWHHSDDTHVPPEMKIIHFDQNWKSCKQFSPIEKSGENCLQLFQFLHALFGRDAKKCLWRTKSAKSAVLALFVPKTALLYFWPKVTATAISFSV